VSSKKHKQAVRGEKKQSRTRVWRDRLLPILRLRWLQSSLAMLVLALVLYQAYARITQSDMFIIETVQIEGEFKYLSKQHLQETAIPYVTGSFFSVKLDAIRNQLLQLPWVEDVSIRRQWPNALTIRVMEKQPVAYWNDKQLISSRSEVFEPAQIDQQMRLPKLNGPQGQHANMLRELSRMQTWLADAELQVEQINQDQRRSWTLHMSSGLELRLGRHDRQQRLQRFVEVFTGKLMKQQQNIKYVDMRYTNGLAVAWKKVTEGLGA
jgi:cell division protein FtsQ